MNAAQVHLWNEPPAGHALWSEGRALPVVRVAIGSGGDSPEDYADACFDQVVRRADIRRALGLDYRGYALSVEGFADEANTDSPNVFRQEDDEVVLADLSDSPSVFTATGRSEGRTWGEAFAARLRSKLESAALPGPSWVVLAVDHGVYSIRSTATGSTGWYPASLADPRATTELIDGLWTLEAFRSIWWAQVTGSPAPASESTEFFDGDTAATDFVYALMGAVDAWALYDTLVRPLVREFPGIRGWSNRGGVFPAQANAAVGRDRVWADLFGGTQAATLAATVHSIDAAPLPSSAFNVSTGSTRQAWATKLGVTLTGDDDVDYEAILKARALQNIQALEEEGVRLSSMVWLDRTGEDYNLGGPSAWNGAANPYTYTSTESFALYVARRAGLVGVPQLVLTQEDDETSDAWDSIELVASQYLRATDMADTSIVWPPALTQKWLISGHDEALGDASISSPVDIGPAKKRRRGTSEPDVVSIRFYATQDERDILEAFFKDTTESGSLAFTREDTATYEDRKFRFITAPRYQIIRPKADVDRATAKVWAVSLTLERLAKPTTPEEDDATLYIVDGDTGTNTFASDSSMTVRLTPGCFLDTNDDGSPESVALLAPITRVYRFKEATGVTTVGEDTYAESIVWTYEEGGFTSTITFDEDDGWSYSNNTNHIRTPTCDAGSGDVVLRPIDGNETTPGEPLFRHKGLDEISGANESELCPVSGEEPTVWAQTIEGTLLRGSGPAVAARASGFRDYEVVCEVPVEFCALSGTVGDFLIAHDSEIEVTTRTGCFTTNLSVTPPDVKIYEFDECVDDGFGATLYVQWSYTDGDGTSWIRLHRDDGWSYNIDADHIPEIACSGTSIEASTGSETSPGYPYFLHNGYTMSNAFADAICNDTVPAPSPAIGAIDQNIDSATSGGIVGPYTPDDPGAASWFPKVVARFLFGSTPSVPTRVGGFVDVVVLCNTGGIHP